MSNNNDSENLVLNDEKSDWTYLIGYGLIDDGNDCCLLIYDADYNVIDEVDLCGPTPGGGDH